MKVRILYNIDKTISVIHPAPKSRRKDETENEWLERVFNKATPLGIEYDEIDDSELPTREDRNAWEGEKGKGISVNTIKAQLIKTERNQEILIQKKIRDNAIADLQTEGVIPNNFIDSKQDLKE